MIYIEEIEITSYKGFPGTEKMKGGFTIECGGVNLLVGDQGCGKSTLLTLLQKADNQNIKISLSDYTIKYGVNSFYFDTEKMNPRVTDLDHYTTPSGQNKGIGFGAAIQSRFRSHGEVIQDFIFQPLETMRDCVILLDEPESGLSITNQFKLIDAVEKSVRENNCQLFIATHCYPLIERFSVISLEHWEQMEGRDFINLVK